MWALEAALALFFLVSKDFQWSGGGGGVEAVRTTVSNCTDAKAEPLLGSQCPSDSVLVSPWHRDLLSNKIRQNRKKDA